MSHLIHPAKLLRTQPAYFHRAFLRQQARGLKIQPARPLKADPKGEHSAHTISQRIKTLKKVPPELIPLGVVLAFALFAAVFAMGRKLTTDKTLRLWKNPPRMKTEHKGKGEHSSNPAS